MYIEKAENWAVGVQIADMHYYASGALEQEADVQSLIKFPLDEKSEPPFWKWLQGMTYGPSYSNKMLILIAEPRYDDYWTAAWSYDGRWGGIVKLKPKQ